MKSALRVRIKIRDANLNCYHFLVGNDLHDSV